MTSLLQISDTHFGTEKPPVAQALERLARRERPDVLVLSGDITQRATQAQFDEAGAFVRRLGIAVTLTIPGNHDIPLFAVATRLLDPYGRYGRAFGTELEPVIGLPGWLVVAVNTTRWYRHKNGEVSPQQIERVAGLLARGSPEQLRLVVVHQPVAVTRDEDRANLLLGRERAVAAWTAAGADLILGGHIHLPFVLPLPGAARNAWCVQAGTAVSSRIRDGRPNSVNLIRPAPDSAARHCSVEQWDYAAAAGEFERVRVHALALSPMLPTLPKAGAAHAG
ncbi:MAG: metallophosphoesterase [Variovorax sp.]